MDFKFNVNRLLPKKINKVTHTLIPEDFRGDRRQLNEYQRQLTRILEDMGEASAKAQGLSKPITSAPKLRDTDHIVYLFVDSTGNGGLGSVLGLLKTGSKSLFLFDENGVHYQLQPRCVLDFYVHETRRRMGLGKELYEHMLTEERLRPVKIAIDRPSEKFLQFLRKHYGLERIIPQNYKFVVFQGFFDEEFQERTNRYTLSSRGSLESSHSKPSSASSNGHSTSHSAVSRSSYGRYAAPRPPCSMANIIHNAPVFGQATEHTGDVFADSKLERPRSLSLYSEDEHKQGANEMTVPTTQIPLDSQVPIEDKPKPEDIPPTPAPETKPAPPQAPKSQSLVSEQPEDNKTSSSIKPPPSCAQEVTGHRGGHLDLKFYHSPLW